MTEEDDSRAGANSLLHAKLSPPGLPAGHVPRTELLHAIRAEEDARLVSVTAPPGYGKTTLLAGLAASEQRPVAWVGLDDADNDPNRFVSLLAAAFGPTQGLPSSFWEVMSSRGGSVLGRLGPRLASAVRSATTPFLFILDDVHEVTALACHDVLHLVVGSVPEGSTLVVAGRSEAPGLARWRVDAPVVEIGSAELAFDDDETARLFRLGGAVLSQQTARDLRERLEGWVAGLQLALIVTKRTGGQDLAFGSRFVADYLQREVLDRSSEALWDFLVRTSILRQLHPDLCDVLLERTDSAAQIAELERDNLFLRPVGGPWHRYHAAFRETLLAELDRSLGSAVREELHARASRWYEDKGMPDEAVEHSLLSGDPSQTARLLAKVAQALNASGQVVTVQRWFRSTGDAAIIGYPPLAILAGWVAALSGDASDAERWAAAIDEVEFDDAPADGSHSFESASAMFRALSCRTGPDQMLADAATALRLEPSWSPWRTIAEGLYAEALLLRGRDGDRLDASAMLDDAVESARRSGSMPSLVSWLSERALLAMDRSEWSRARHDVADAMRLVEEVHLDDYFDSTMAFAAAARIALHDGHRAGAERFAMMAMRSRGITTYAVPFWAVRLRLVLARVHLALGEPVAARHLLREVDDVRRRRPELGALVDELEQVRHLASAAPLTNGRTPLSAAELRVLPYLQTHLTFDEMAQRLFLSRNTVASHVKSIYRKLGASTRGEAVSTAVALGLVGDFAAGATS